MPRAITCLFNHDEICVCRAIKIKEATKTTERKNLEFMCVECGARVRPHKAGGNMADHFEHLIRNPKCNLSDPAR